MTDTPTEVDPPLTPEQYGTGAVKQHPDTLEVARRCEPGMPREWAALTPDGQCRYVHYDDVEGWVDLKPVPEQQTAAARRKKT